MNDRELLEAAAKVAGIEWTRWVSTGGGMDGLLLCNRFKVWNPMKSDQDAFRLMVDLRLEVDCDDRFDEDGEVFACAVSNCGKHMAFGSSDDDPRMATRTAIVLCAAALASPLND